MLSEITLRTPFGLSLLCVMPWAVDFHERMKIFRAALDAERLQVCVCLCMCVYVLYLWVYGVLLLICSSILFAKSIFVDIQ